MLLAAVAFVLVPLRRAGGKGKAVPLAAGAVIVAVAAAVYWHAGSPEARFVVAADQVQTPESIDAMVASLAARLEDNPDDVDGWKMLGRSYRAMERFEESVDAYERAMELEGSSNGQTVAELAEALFLADADSLNGRAGELFETALALSPGNAKALFFSGLSAAGRGDNALAADRWEALLATSPPPEVAEALRSRIALLRGETPAAMPAPVQLAGKAVSIEIQAGDNVTGLDASTTVFVIARDPAQPMPPVAVARRQWQELPATVTLSDADAMLPGRPLSAFQRLEIVVRASASGQPTAQPGDWFGEATVDRTSETSVAITVDRQVR